MYSEYRVLSTMEQGRGKAHLRAACQLCVERKDKVLYHTRVMRYVCLDAGTVRRGDCFIFTLGSSSGLSQTT